MNSATSVRRAVTVPGVMVLLVAGCSSDDDAADSERTDPTDVSAAAPSTTGPVDDTIPPAADPRVSTVFTSGEEGYDTYRIPAIIRADDGSLIAFAGGREDGPHDNTPRDIVAKRSVDQGETWGQLMVIADADGYETVDPVPFLDRDTGRLIVLSDRFAHEGSTQDPDAVTGVLISVSDDDGASWSEPEAIEGETGGFGPGHGVQLEQGPHAGRLLLAGHQEGGGHLAVSDDGGATWRITGRDTSSDGRFPNESTATELSDGTILVNARDAGSADEYKRLAAASGDDGGAAWRIAGRVRQRGRPGRARGPGFSAGGGRPFGDEVVLFSAPSNPAFRHALRLRISDDGGATWADGPLVWPGPSAYSDLVALDGTEVGILYEAGDEHLYERIDFASFDVTWLDTDPEPAPTLPDDFTIADDTTGFVRQGDERWTVDRACLSAELTASIDIAGGSLVAAPDATLSRATVEVTLDDGREYSGSGSLHISGFVWSEGTVIDDAGAESDFFASFTGLEPCEAEAE